MASLSVKLPLKKSSINGYAMIADFQTLVRQNLKMICLTVPGERVMEPNFGAGIKRFLFSNEFEQIDTQIRQVITEQVERYLPIVFIDDIAITITPETNSMFIQLKYRIPQVGVKDLLQFTI